MLFLLISFFAGVLTILAPCILPLLPVIVGHSITDATLSKKRLYTVVASLGLSIVIFTLLLKASTLLFSIPEDFWKYFSGGIIFIFGVVTLFPSIWESLPFVNKINQKSNQTLAGGYQKNSLWGDIVIGASLGPIFSACSPTYFVILATVLPATPVLGIIYLLIYALGLSFALILVAFLGQKIVVRLGMVSDSRGVFKKVIGVIFILVALGIMTGYDKKLQTRILDAGFFDVTKLEQKILDKQEAAPTPEGVGVPTKSVGKEQKAILIKKEDLLSATEKNKKYPLAPDISTPDAFINTNGEKINISQYRGKKVVLLDIWTYSCINCQRTLPYLKEWYKKYEDDGLVIIGLHTPEFAFEQKENNVKNAVEEFKIKYPVVMDNDFSTWKAYGNRYWPMKYLIDLDGFVVYAHAGEGDYDKTELKIQELLAELQARLDIENHVASGVADPKDKIVVAGEVGSPETYFGSSRNEFLANGEPQKTGEQTFIIPADIKLNKLYLGGKWNITPEYASGSAGSEITYKYKSKNMYMTAGSADGAEVEVYIDGKLSKTINIKNETLYTLIGGTNYDVHTMTLKIKSGSLEAFTFTFG